MAQLRKKKWKARRMSRRVYAPCVECGGEGKPVMGSTLFPNSERLRNEIFFACECGAYVGSGGGGQPAGYPAGEDTRRERAKAYTMFHASVREGIFASVSAATAWLAHELDIPQAVAFISKMDGPTAVRVTRMFGELLNETRRVSAEEDATESKKDAQAQRQAVEDFKEEPPAFLRTAASGAHSGDGVLGMRATGDRASRDGSC